MNTYIVKGHLFSHIITAGNPSGAWIKANTEEQALNNLLDAKECREQLLQNKFMFIESTKIPEVYLCKR